jgi:hypothetical protein
VEKCTKVEEVDEVKAAKKRAQYYRRRGKNTSISDGKVEGS